MSNITSRRIQILVDEPEVNPGKEFKQISNTIYQVITNSKPQFTIGITGKWGTGKTTMMKAIRSEFEINKKSRKTDNPPNEKSFLQLFFDLGRDISVDIPTSEKKDTSLPDIKNEIMPTAWFNAWRFERENTKATIPLIITIIERLLYWIRQHEKSYVQDGKNPIYKKLRNEIVGFLNSCDHHLQVTIPGVFTYDLTRSAKIKGELGYENNENDTIVEIKKPVLQKGLDIIDQLISDLKKNTNGFRLIVFVDDLDRCSPQKALEVLESIKILLGIEGIVYVVGISDRTIQRLIDTQYEGTGIRGEDYIKKIIQVKYPLRTWTSDDIKNLIERNILPELKNNAPKFLTDKKTKEKNYQMISNAIEANPRELKRFLNNLILSFELIKNKGMSEENLLIIEALKSRWEEFFLRYSDEKSTLRKTLSELKDDNLEEIKKSISIKREKKEIISTDEEFIEKITLDLWNFFINVKEKLESITSKQWPLYLHATESIEDMDPSTSNMERGINMEMFDLLKQSRIDEFNKTRPNLLNLGRIGLRGISLQGINLQGVDFHHSDLRGIDLQSVNLPNANLQDSNLLNAIMRNAIMHEADLRNANLRNADLQAADLRSANLQDAILQQTDLQYVNLRNANLRNADLRELT